MRKLNHRLFARINTKRPVSIEVIKKQFNFSASASQHRTHQTIITDPSAAVSLRRDFARFFKMIQASDRVYLVSSH